mmetsp:Transcript_24527/g.45376  ORF Transcript_24527/g.45376 Transcript_24527/m.45376 type:complete len:209 (+) Transcript_24527:555-1181(+)
MSHHLEHVIAPHGPGVLQYASSVRRVVHLLPVGEDETLSRRYRPNNSYVMFLSTTGSARLTSLQSVAVGEAEAPTHSSFRSCNPLPARHGSKVDLVYGKARAPLSWVRPGGESRPSASFARGGRSRTVRKIVRHFEILLLSPVERCMMEGELFSASDGFFLSFVSGVSGESGEFPSLVRSSRVSSEATKQEHLDGDCCECGRFSLCRE